MINNNFYVLVDTHDSWIDMDDYQSKMVTPFRIEESSKGLRMFPANVIVSPLAVITNYKSPTSIHYLVCLPPRVWGNIFSQGITLHMGNDGAAILDEIIDNHEYIWLDATVIVDLVEDICGEEEDEPEQDDDKEEDETEQENQEEHYL